MSVPILPEAVSDRQWTVGEHAPVYAIDTRLRQILLGDASDFIDPDAANAAEYQILGRAAFSPRDVSHGAFDPIGMIKTALEEVRVQALLAKRAGIDTSGRYGKEPIKPLPANAAPWQYALNGIYGQSATRSGLDDRDPMLDQQVKWAIDIVRAGPSTTRARNSATEALARLLFGDGTTPALGGRKRPSAFEQERIWRGRKGASVDHPMEICDHVSPASTVKRRAHYRRYGAADTGVVPLLWERWAIDRQVFTRRRRTMSLLIDCSGSMRWEWKRLSRIVDSHPAAVIAAYQGTDSGGTDNGMTYGRLCIIARNGLVAEYRDPRLARAHKDWNGENNVDYEALEWLASQPKPRIFLSDNVIAGGRHGVADCDALRERHKIAIMPEIPMT